MPTETITVKIEDLQKGDVLPGGGKIRKVTEAETFEVDTPNWSPAYLSAEWLESLFGPTVEVTREVPEPPTLAPFETVVTEYGPLGTGYVPNVGQYPTGTGVTVYPSFTLPKPSLSVEGRASLDWLCGVHYPGVQKRAQAIRAELAEGKPAGYKPPLPADVAEAVKRWDKETQGRTGYFDLIADWVWRNFDCSDAPTVKESVTVAQEPAGVPADVSTAARAIVEQEFAWCNSVLVCARWILDRPRPKLPEDVARAVRWWTTPTAHTSCETQHDMSASMARFIRDLGYEVEKGE